jgi:hypothetical protein
MKRIFLILTFLVSLCNLFAQVDSTKTAADDDMNLFLLVFAVVAISVILGAAIVGAFAATLFLLLASFFVSVGILSVSVLIGFYKRSIRAAFKTLLYIVCAIIGMAIGAAGFYLIARLFHFDVSAQTSLIAGIISGLVGGLIMAYIISFIIKLTWIYFAKKLSAENNGKRN